MHLHKPRNTLGNSYNYRSVFYIGISSIYDEHKFREHYNPHILGGFVSLALIALRPLPAVLADG